MTKNNIIINQNALSILDKTKEIEQINNKIKNQTKEYNSLLEKYNKVNASNKKLEIIIENYENEKIRLNDLIDNKSTTIKELRHTQEILKLENEDLLTKQYLSNQNLNDIKFYLNSTNNNIINKINS